MTTEERKQSAIKFKSRVLVREGVNLLFLLWQLPLAVLKILNVEGLTVKLIDGKSMLFC